MCVEDRRARGFGLLLVAGCHDDVGARPGEGLGRLEAEAPVGARDDGGAPAEVGDVGDGPGHGVLLRV